MVRLTATCGQEYPLLMVSCWAPMRQPPTNAVTFTDGSGAEMISNNVSHGSARATARLCTSFLQPARTPSLLCAKAFKVSWHHDARTCAGCCAIMISTSGSRHETLSSSRFKLRKASTPYPGIDTMRRSPPARKGNKTAFLRSNTTIPSHDVSRRNRGEERPQCSPKY